VVAEGSPAELKERSGGQVIEARPANHADVAAVTRVLSAVAGVPAVPERDTVAVPAADPALLGAAVSRLAAERITVSQIGLRLPSLDEAFLRLTAGSTAGSAVGSGQ
jgi:oleandomycin transport system ATP-binding protein